MLSGRAESTSHGNLLKNTNSQALSQFHGIRHGVGEKAEGKAGDLCFSQASWRFWRIMKSENYHHNQKKKCKETGEDSEKNNEAEGKA